MALYLHLKPAAGVTIDKTDGTPLAAAGEWVLDTTIWQTALMGRKVVLLSPPAEEPPAPKVAPSAAPIQEH